MILVAALLLDALAGEPRWLWSRVPHPAVLAGRAISWADDNINHGDRRREKGVVTCAALCVVAVAAGLFFAGLPSPVGPLVELLLVAVLLAQRSLADHVRAVADALRLSAGDGRLVVARIVGRDTSGMDESAIARAAIESAAENFSDGVVAPVFWYLVAGLPGILVYKVVNTADSMIGYRTPRHAAFGWASARLDDVLNWIPARLSALLIMLSRNAWHAWPVLRRDAVLHRSPNAGWPEAAMAGALGIALAGPRSYAGEMREFPFVNEDGRHEIGPADIDRAVRTLWRAWAWLLGTALLFALL